MTKYARTKDGKIVKVNLEGDVFTSRYEIVGEPKDSIEELCDVYVLDEKLYYNIEDLKLHIKQLKEWNKWPAYLIKPYGAIWTDKGLIYVAKMNDKGEFELI